MAIDQKTLSGLRERLEEDLSSSRSDLKQIKSDIRSLTQDDAQEGGVPTNHMADEGSEVYERERLMTIEVEIVERIDLIEAAIERMDNGTFGTCERCGREIAAARLEALPFVRYCIECQEIVDNEQHVEGVKNGNGR